MSKVRKQEDAIHKIKNEQSLFYDKEIVVFDLDGTLVELNIDWAEARKQLKETFSKLKFTADEYHTSIMIERIGKKLGKNATKKAEKILRDLEMKSSIKPKKKMLDLAKSFHKSGKKLAILSNNSHDTIEMALKKVGIIDIFKFIVGREDVVEHKPKPEGLLIIMKHFGAKKKKVGFIGNDVESDLGAGQAAGVETILVQNITF